jgi:hypothetical protein
MPTIEARLDFSFQTQLIYLLFFALFLLQQEVERFPLSLVHDPVSVVSDDKKDIYNNIILFTVLQDNKKNSSTPSEMHIFQCNRSHVSNWNSLANLWPNNNTPRIR